MKQGYTKRVLLAQIRKYENALRKPDDDLFSWIIKDFSTGDNCPICNYQDTCCATNKMEACPAIVDDVMCDGQKWYITVYDVTPTTIKSARRALETRLKYWQRIYKEKYSEVYHD